MGMSVWSAVGGLWFLLQATCSSAHGARRNNLRWTANRWSMGGFGNCPLRQLPGSARLQVPNLRSCLRRCEAKGRNCNFASYLNVDILGVGRRKVRSACYLARECPSLMTSHPGAVTFARGPSRSIQRRWAKLGPSDSLASLSLAGAVTSASQWRPQLCNSAGKAELSWACQRRSRGSFQILSASSIVAGNNSLKISSGVEVYITMGGISGQKLLSLCGLGSGSKKERAGDIYFAERCPLRKWSIELRGKEEQCLRLRLSGHPRGMYLAARDRTVSLVPWSELNSTRTNSCWIFGYKQSLNRLLPRRMADKARNLGEVRHRAQRTHVWVIASNKYQGTLDRLVRNLNAARDPVRLHIQRTNDYKDVQSPGFSAIGAEQHRMFLYHNYIKAQALYQQLLMGASLGVNEDNSASVHVFLALDVQVFPDWTRVVRSCVVESDEQFKKCESWHPHCKKNIGVADVCFTQQPGFYSVKRYFLANSGVIVSRGGSEGATACFSAVLARNQMFAVFSHLFPHFSGGAFAEPGQTSLNIVLNQARQSASPRAFRWGIYNPTLLHSGMYTSETPLSTVLHHATGSYAKLSEKILLLDAEEAFFAEFGYVCDAFGPGGVFLVEGPLRAECLVLRAEDPHFNYERPAIPWYSIYQEFMSEEIVMQMLPRRHTDYGGLRSNAYLAQRRADITRKKTRTEMYHCLA
ncbi:unnamed protein product [Polarella glacialis]|uniref:Protein xylosyltransferase n=1 Tax=Polarella glacialis TaxID=89957 RepID=A0A813F0A4_POLGL|nr:unnamed protein product [Polarella glacialis]